MEPPLVTACAVMAVDREVLVAGHARGRARGESSLQHEAHGGGEEGEAGSQSDDRRRRQREHTTSSHRRGWKEQEKIAG